MRLLRKVVYWYCSVPAGIILLVAWGMQILAEWVVAGMYKLEGPEEFEPINEDVLDDNYPATVTQQLGK